MPLVLATNLSLAGDPGPTKHFQREEMQFYPNENARQSFKRNLFNGLCAGCHGSVNGAELHAAVRTRRPHFGLGRPSSGGREPLGRSQRAPGQPGRAGVSLSPARRLSR